MINRLPLLFFYIAMLLPLFSNAEIFVVTSNADSGTGTLREALQKASDNGTQEHDRILFQLADTTLAGRTIVLQSELPALSSLLIIDASTQDGGYFYPSQAKVHITADKDKYLTSAPYYAVLYGSNLKSIYIYGLYIGGFNGVKNKNPSIDLHTCGPLNLNMASQIQVGEAGKGNYFTDEEGATYVMAQFNANGTEIIQQNENVVFQSNIIHGYFISMADNQTFGGNSKEDGNTIYARNPSFYGDNLSICNNKTLKYWGEIEDMYLGVLGLINFEIHMTRGLLVKDNDFYFSRIMLYQVEDFRITGNKDLDEIQIWDSKNGTVGTDDMADANIIRPGIFGMQRHYGTRGIRLIRPEGVLVKKNSIVCARIALYIEEEKVSLPEIKVLVNNDTEYAGTATPNTDVYVYEDNTDCEVCSPVLFYKKIRVDANGNWKMTGDFRGKKWVSNVSDAYNSSEFTQIEMYVSEFIAQEVRDATCGQANGSIKLIKYNAHVMDVDWEDEEGNIIGHGFEIKNLKGGKSYVAVAKNGNCKVRKHYFIWDWDEQTAIQAYTDAMEIVPASCNKPTGAIKGIMVYNESYRFEWINERGAVISDELNPTALPIGSYNLRIIDGICSKTIGPYEIVEASETIYPDFSSILTPATCGESNGGILLTVSGLTVPARIQWMDVMQQWIGEGASIGGLNAGTYSAYFTDQYGCQNLWKTFQVPAIVPLEVSMQLVHVQNDACGMGEGFLEVRGVHTGLPPYSYNWTDQSGKTVGQNAKAERLYAGSYWLRATDESGCVQQIGPIEIINEQSRIEPPQLSVNYTCAGQQVIIRVQHPISSFFRLYNDMDAAVAIDEGDQQHIFSQKVTSTQTFYVSAVVGGCESERTPIILEPGNGLTIPNIFSPNGDGTNDTWLPKGLEHYPQTTLQIYSRGGNRVYLMSTTQSPFDGNYAGSPLPEGAYYYVLDLGNGCTPIKGSITLVR